MAEKRVVLITGVAGFWGGAVAARLVAQPGLHVIGLDAEPPKEAIKGLDFIQADLRNPLLGQLLADEAVAAVCHLAFVDSSRPSEQAFEVNVMGGMHVLAACGAAGVRQVVVRSSTMVYGAQAGNSAFLREDHALHGSRGYGYVRDLVEMEAFCNGFRGQHPSVDLTLLRLAHVVGPTCDSPLTRFLRDEEAFALVGFDPMMQVLHEADAVAALAHAVLHPAPGVFNVAAPGVLPLWRLMGLAGKAGVPVLHPLAYLSVSLFGPRFAPLDLDYLRYPCVADVRRMERELGFTPQYTAEEALREFAAQQRLRRYLPEAAVRAYDEDRLRDTLERRRRARARGQSDDQPPAPNDRKVPARGRTARRGQAAKDERPRTNAGRGRKHTPATAAGVAPIPVTNQEEGINGQETR
jgi:UDP-glucose 4-epimerase